MAQINAEFGRGNNLNSYRGTQWYTAAGGSGTFSTGAISFSDFYGKQLASPAFSFTISSHLDQANLRTLAVNAGWNQSTPVVATLASGYYIYSTVLGAAALTIDGSFPGGVTLINNGFIMGKGGNGGSAPPAALNTTGNGGTLQSGSLAIVLGVSCTIQNNSYIGGGGGGGGGGRSTGTSIYTSAGSMGGGGAGGGNGGGTLDATGAIATAGGAGGGIGASGSNGPAAGSTGGGGGRIMPGTRVSPANVSIAGGISATAGFGAEGGVAGGNYFISPIPMVTTQTTNISSLGIGLGGGAGGAGNSSAGQNTIYGSNASSGGGGGGWGSSGGTSRAAIASTGYGTMDIQFSGGSGGKCVHLNGYSVTWSATGTRYGAIS
jgi:hypothetical protein